MQRDDSDFIKLENSITEFGYIEPIIWNKRTGNIVGGHQRLNVLKSQGENQAEAVVVDLGEHDEKMLNVMLNRTTGDWDTEKLNTLLRELDEAGADLAITGFDDWELQGLTDDSSLLDDILAFYPGEEETGGDEEESGSPTTTETLGNGELYDIEFVLPIEYRPLLDAFIVAYGVDDSNAMLAEAVLDLVRGEQGGEK